MTNEELSQQIAALTTTVTEKFNEIDKRLEGIDGRLDKLQAGQDDLVTKYDDLKAGQDDLVTKYDELKAGQDDLVTKYDELKAGQDDLVTKYDSLKAGQDDLVAKHADLQVGLDDLRTKYDELNEKQGHIVNAQKTIAKMQADLQHTIEEQGAKAGGGLHRHEGGAGEHPARHRTDQPQDGRRSRRARHDARERLHHARQPLPRP